MLLPATVVAADAATVGRGNGDAVVIIVSVENGVSGSSESDDSERHCAYTFIGFFSLIHNKQKNIRLLTK